MKKIKKVKIIALVGMAGAGKSEACSFFQKKGLPILRFGDQTDIGLDELKMDIIPENEKWYREKLRKDLGMEAYAIKILPRIKREIKKGERIIVLDGLYSWEEYLFLKKEFAELILLSVYACPSTRYRRLMKRKWRSLSHEQAKERDMAELSNLNKGGPIAIADYLIENNGSLKAFYEKLENFFQLFNEQN